MMERTDSTTLKSIFDITGLTCSGCVAKVRSVLEKDNNILSAEPDLGSSKVIIVSKEKIDEDQLNKILEAYPQYKITKKVNPENNSHKFMRSEGLQEISLFTTYKPLFIITGFIILVSSMIQFPFEEFSWILLMRHFMAGFFITFSFFKLLNLKGFASSYRMYDIIAKQWGFWAFIYPFIELILGLLYLTNIFPLFTNIITIAILGTASIGVIQSNLQKRKIRCACLGDIFNLPMSTVTIIEDVTMVLMAGIMLIIH